MNKWQAFLQKFLAFVLCTLSGLVTAQQGEYAGASDAPTPSWFKESFLTFEDDIQEATDAGKRVLIYVHQSGCPYCSALITQNFSQRDIEKRVRENYDVIMINMWGDAEIKTQSGESFTEKTFAKAIGVQYTPTLIFLDEAGDVLLRLNGYVPPDKFLVALDYVDARRTQDISYREFVSTQSVPESAGLSRKPTFKSHKPERLAQKESQRPLMVLFEQQACPACDTLHKNVFADAVTQKLLEDFDVVVLDMWSDQAITSPAGTSTTVKAWADELGVAYAPSALFFDAQGEEVMRVDAFLKSFHFQSVLDYVRSGSYREEKEFQRYIQARADELREQGIDVDIWKD